MAMKEPRQMSRDQLMFGATLVILALLAVLLWLKDPNHQIPGKSRVDWPPPTKKP